MNANQQFEQALASFQAEMQDAEERLREMKEIRELLKRCIKKLEEIEEDQ